MNDNIPTIEGVEMHAPALLDDGGNPVAFAQPRQITTILGLINEIPGRTSNPELAQLFMLNALESFSEAVSKAQASDDAAFEAATGGAVAGADWREIAGQINSIIVYFVKEANEQQPDSVDAAEVQAGSADQGPVGVAG